MESIDQTALAKGMNLLKAFKDVTGNGEMQMQTMLTFLYVAYRHPNSVPMREIEQQFGFTQTTNSRNVHYWAMTEAEVERASRQRAKGNFAEAKAAVKDAGGAAMLKVEVDPLYAKRKLITLTPKGQKFAGMLSKTLGF